jgi:uncharacterized phage protein (TIGR01671 family)
MRDIKFRVWDKYKKQMYPISSIDYDIFSQEIRIIAVGHENGMCTAYNKNHNSEKCDITALELMQYTGLNDKNGKEIYEGDIVKVDNIDLAIIYFDDDRMAWGIKPINEFYFDSPLLSENISLELRVIGNIYDNSDLLKK